ncbi:MAG: hypothetical protein V2A72_06210 [Candidatus Omnitrophota bacterium]
MVDSIERNMETNKKELRKFGVIFGAALAIIGTLHLFKGRVNVYPWFYAVSAVIFILGIFAPVALKPLQIVLKKTLEVIMAVTTLLVLTALFYLVLTLISLIAKLFGKGFLDIDWNKKANTYWIAKETPQENIERYEKQF